jgi:hypothetical protein
VFFNLSNQSFKHLQLLHKCHSQSGSALGSHWVSSLALSPICENVFDTSTHFRPHGPLHFTLSHEPDVRVVTPRVLSQPHFGQVWGWDSHSQKVGTWSPSGLLQLQSSTAEGKTPRLEVFFMPLERPWSVDVENGLAWAIWTFAAQVMVEKRARSQTGSLTPNHKKSGIDPTPGCAVGVRHTVGELLRRSTRLLQTSSQSEVWVRSYKLPKSRESKPGQFRDSSLGVPGIKAIWMRAPQSNAENTIWGKVVASPESGPWWVKWVQGHPWLVPTLKGCRMSSNQLVGWFWMQDWITK